MPSWKLCLGISLPLCFSLGAAAAAKPAKPQAVIASEESTKSVQELNELLAKAVEENKQKDYREELQLTSSKTTISLEELAKSAQLQPPPMQAAPEAE